MNIFTLNDSMLMHFRMFSPHWDFSYAFKMPFQWSFRPAACGMMCDITQNGRGSNDAPTEEAGP